MNPRVQRLHRRIALLSGLWILGFLALAPAQSPRHFQGHVHDASGHPIQAATVAVYGPRGVVSTLSDPAGSFALDYPTPAGELTLRASTRSMESDPLEISA